MEVRRHRRYLALYVLRQALDGLLLLSGENGETLLQFHQLAFAL